MKSGIYIITNEVNGKSYIGLSSSLDRRWVEHQRMLKKNKHHSVKLQNSWNKYGADKFKYEVLEYCKEEELVDKEEIYIRKYDSYYNGLNMTPGGEKQCSGIHNGMHNKTKYTFYNIDGRVEENITCLEMVEKYGYKKGKSHIYSVAAGTRDVSDGWVTNKEVLEQSRKGFKYKFYHLDGTVTDFLTQSEFNIKYNINNDGAVSALILKKIEFHIGWFRSLEDIEKYKDRKKKRNRDIINDNGDIKRNVSQQEFREMTGSDSCSSSQLFSGKYKVVKGWRLLTE